MMAMMMTIMTSMRMTTTNAPVTDRKISPETTKDFSPSTTGPARKNKYIPINNRSLVATEGAQKVLNIQRNLTISWLSLYN